MRDSIEADPVELGREVSFLRQRMRDFELALEDNHRASLDVVVQLAGVRTALQSKNAQLGAFVVGCFFGGALVLMGAAVMRLSIR